MKTQTHRLTFAALMTLLAGVAQAGEPVAGGITLPFAANVDGVDYPANTTFYAETYPTQFLVKPIVTGETKIFFGSFDSAHGGGKVYPDYTGTQFLLMPPPAVDDVATFSLQTFSANHVWVDAKTDVPKDEQDGSVNAPYKVLQDGVDPILAKSKSFNMVLVRSGDYNEGGTEKTAKVLASRVTVRVSKNCFIIRAVDGPAVTTIFGAKDTTSGAVAPYVGWGENGVRCAKLTDGSVLQGFTLRDGSGATKEATEPDFKTGGAVSGSGSAKSMMLDCVVSNGCANVGAVAGLTAIRCKFIDNEGRTCILSDVPNYSCVFYQNALVNEGASFGYFSSSPVNNATFAGNVKLNMGTCSGYNSVFQGVAKASGVETGANNWAWDIDSGTPSAAYTVQDPVLADVSAGDLRLGEISPCIDAIEKPTAANYGADYWKTAWGDVEGNRLRVGPNGELTPGAFQSTFPEVYAGELYVDPVNGNDTENDGWKRTRPLKTLAAAFAHKKCAAGTTVYVEPAVFDAANTPAVTSDEGGMLNRVSVPAGVALVSLGSAANTFIIGARGTKTDLPTRCVQLRANSSIRGFTLTGGDTDANENGGAVYARSSSAGARVYDCVLTNNISGKRGGAASGCTLHRCYFADNQCSDNNGLATTACTLINCVVDSQKRGGTRCFTTSVRNCTFLPSKSASLAEEAVNYSGNVSADYCKNSIFLCKTRAEADYTSCLIATNAIDVGTRTYNPDVLGSTVQLVTLAEAAVKKDGRLRAKSPAVDAGNDALYDNDWGDRDFKGNARIVGASIDLGAIEFDPSLYKGAVIIFD